jgi:hypothetical protein
LQKEILNQRATLLTLKEEIEKRLATADERLQAFKKKPEDLQSLAEEFAFLKKNQTAVREALLAFDQGLA